MVVDGNLCLLVCITAIVIVGLHENAGESALTGLTSIGVTLAGRLIG